ncbi:hypothetical protein LCGC14_1625840 [marine sediment metagenome]|uniref:Uncharacterized protein n=2 Tax=root TaxID=1 RepID=A0A831VLG2_9FLAO|nr:hypothetical protein [Pricia antarctica]
MGNNLMNLLKTNQPGVSLSIADLIGPRGMNDTSGNASGYKQAVEELQRAAGINHIVQINDCETQTDWTESDNGTFDRAVGNAGVKVGTNSLKLTATASTDNTQYVETVLINESTYVPKTADGERQMDWRDTDYIGFWQHAVQSAEYGTAGEMQFAIMNNGVLSDKTEITGNVTTSHAWFQIDISGFSRDKVEAIRFYSNNTNTAEDFYADNIIRYKYALGGAPIFGSYYYITSGTTLTEGNGVKWGIAGLTVASATEAVVDLGPAFLGGATATGTAARNVYAQLPGKFIFMMKASTTNTAGAGVQFAGATTVEDGDAGNFEHSFAKALEAAGETGDWIFCIYDTAGQEV